MKTRITHYTVKLDGKMKTPVTLALLSDLHNAECEEEIMQALMREKPTAVISAGDMVTAKGGRCAYDKAVHLINRIAQHFPIYLVRGNHEERMRAQESRYPGRYADYLAQIQGENVRMLDDRTEMLVAGGRRLALTGYALGLEYYHRRGRKMLMSEEITQAVGKPIDADVHILAAHHPDFFPAYAKWGADLSLCGHVHGGIVRIPLLGGVFGATYCLFPKYTRGMYSIGQHKMILSAGLGAHTIKLRFNNPTELVMIHIQ